MAPIVLKLLDIITMNGNRKNSFISNLNTVFFLPSQWHCVHLFCHCTESLSSLKAVQFLTAAVPHDVPESSPGPEVVSALENSSVDPREENMYECKINNFLWHVIYDTKPNQTNHKYNLTWIKHFVHKFTQTVCWLAPQLLPLFKTILHITECPDKHRLYKETKHAEGTLGKNATGEFLSLRLFILYHLLYTEIYYTERPPTNMKVLKLLAF